MKRIRGFITIILAFVVMSGCAGNQGMVTTVGGSTRQDVFQEISPGAEPMPGYADLRISSSLKTHKPGIYPGKDIHGTADFKIRIAIDGQAVVLRGELRGENVDSGARRDPEAGEGIRYQFSGNLRIKAGTHQVVIAVPDDGIEIEREITLPDGSGNSLTLEPVYNPVPGKQRPGFYGVTSFTEGLNGFRVILNDKPI